MAETLLQAEDIVAGYQRPVVGPFSIAIGRAEVVGLSGPNGCGKSTILKALANGARIFSGRVQRKPGLTLAWQQQQQVDLSGVPFSGRDYLRAAGANMELTPMRLRGWLDQRVDSLSGGQSQLLGVWAVLGGDADLVLLDEPTNNLDPEGEHILEQSLRSGPDGRAVLLVSHERHFLERVCDRVLEVGR
jgi:ATPase subunit of ABC transporter with duplicated ATPase domains